MYQEIRIIIYHSLNIRRIPKDPTAFSLYNRYGVSDNRRDPRGNSLVLRTISLTAGIKYNGISIVSLIFHPLFLSVSHNKYRNSNIIPPIPPHVGTEINRRKKRLIIYYIMERLIITSLQLSSFSHIIYLELETLRYYYSSFLEVRHEEDRMGYVITNN